MLVFVAFVQLVYVSASVLQLQMSLVREWESVELHLPGKRIPQRPFDQHHNDLSYYLFWEYLLQDVYNDRLFVAFDLYGTPFSLAYHNLSDTSKSLLLQPYPSWDAHSDMHALMQKVMAIRTDRCDRLWVIYRGYSITDNHLIVFDLNTDRILRKHTFRQKIYYPYRMVVDDNDCENSYLYMLDGQQDGILTYSWTEETVWHHPGGFVSAMVLAPSKRESDSIVYFNKLDREVWYISTRYLKDKTSNLLEFEHRTDRYVNLDLAALDVKNNVLFFKISHTSTSIWAYLCWDIYEWCDMSVRYDIAVNTTHKVSQIKLDKNGNLWAFTETSTFKDNQINLSIFSVAIPSSNYDDSSTTVTIEDTLARTPNSDITATDPASSTTEQDSGVDYNDSNTIVTIEDTIASTPNNVITATYPAISTTEQDSGVDYNDSNTIVTIEDTIASTPNNVITATYPAISTTEQDSGVDYNDSNTIVTIEDTIASTPNNVITATYPAISTTEQDSGVDYNDSNTIVTIEDTIASTPNNVITATYPAISTTEQDSGVDYNDSNTTVTIEDTIASTPNNVITATYPAISTTEQDSGVDYNDSNTTVTIEDTIASTPNNDITVTDPASSTTEQDSGVHYNGINNNTASIEDIIAGTPNSDIATQAIGGNKVTQFANILFSFTNSSLFFSNFTIYYSPNNNVN